MSNAETNRAVPFLAAFNAIERFLRDTLGAKKSDSFSWLSRLAARQGVLTLQQSETLQEFAELRNAISHGEYEDLRPIAEPLPETVAQIERLRDTLLAPTAALAVVEHQQVVSFSPDDNIREPLGIVASKGMPEPGTSGDSPAPSRS